MYSVQCAVCRVPCAVCSAVCRVQCAVCSVQCAVCRVQCAVEYICSTISSKSTYLRKDGEYHSTMCDANQPVPDRVACGLRNGKESVSEVDPPHDRCLPMAATLAEGSSWILFAPELYTFLEIEKEVCVRAAQRTTDRSHLRPLSSCPEGGALCQGCSRTESRTQWTQPSSI